MDASFYSQYNSSTTLALLPSVCVATWHVAFIIFGVNSLADDERIRDSPCGQSSHMFKYALMNTLFAFFGIVTYCFFPGGGEGARARAMVITIFHFAFLAWGILMWMHLTGPCQDVIDDSYGTIKLFMFICIAHNGLFGLLFFMHEMFSGEWLGFDMTLVAEVTVKKDHFRHSSPSENPHQAVLPVPAPPLNNPEQNDGALSKYLKENPMPEPVAGSPYNSVNKTLSQGELP